MDLSFDNSTSRSARLRRELRNPSLLTIIIILVIVSTIVLGPFAPGWVTTTRNSFDAIATQKDIQDRSMSSLGAIVPSQIAPWMGQQVNTMINAEGPLDWQVVTWRAGPCDPGNLSQLPASKYSTSIATACGELDTIQVKYSGNCFRASTCNVSDAAKQELRTSMDKVWNEFSDAGFVLPYDLLEQQVLP